MKRTERLRYDFRKVLSDNIKNLMQHHDVLNSQSEIARRCGLPQRTVGRILNGETQANLSSIVGIATAFGIEPWQILVPGLDPSDLPRLRSVPDEQAAAIQKLTKAISEMPGIEKLFAEIVAPERDKEHEKRASTGVRSWTSKPKEDQDGAAFTKDRD